MRGLFQKNVRFENQKGLIVVGTFMLGRMLCAFDVPGHHSARLSLGILPLAASMAMTAVTIREGFSTRSLAAFGTM